MDPENKAMKDAKKTALSYANDWGKSPLPPMLLATLITSLHMRPFQALPMLFPPILLFSTYLNLSSFVVDSAGITAAWSGIYLVMASRRKTPGRFTNRFGTRGLVRGASMGVAAANLVAGGLTYTFGKREDESEEP